SGSAAVARERAGRHHGLGRTFFGARNCPISSGAGGGPMFRALIFVVATALGVQTLAASEADKQGCVASQSPDARVEACTRVLAEQGASDALRMLAFRGRAAAYSAKRVYALAVLDF